MTVVKFLVPVGPGEMWTDGAISGMVGKWVRMNGPDGSSSKASIVSAERCEQGVELGLDVSPEVADLVRGPEPFRGLWCRGANNVATP